MSGKTLLTPIEAAALMGISVDDLAVMRANDDGPEWGRWKGTIRFAARDVGAWIQASR